MSQTYKKTGVIGIFGEELRLAKLSKQGDPLQLLKDVIDWDLFAPILSEMDNREKLAKSGCKPYNPMLMFKILILQRYYNLGDDQMEYQILDRLSFCRFLGLTLNDRVPDSKTIWLFRERLISKGLERKLFDAFNAKLKEHGLIANQGQIIDASFVEMPKQRNTREENTKIKEGKGDKLWHNHPNKKRQKDIDARWTKKNNETHFGCKDNIKMDNGWKFIKEYCVSSASTHDSQVLDELLEEDDQGQDVYADSAYTGSKQEATLKKYKVNNRVHEKGYKNRPLTEEQKISNHQKSKIRARVEHVFGFIERSMNRLAFQCIGLKRTRGIVGLVNLTYNLFRYEQLVRIHGISMPKK